MTNAQRQWLEFFGNRPFSQEPDHLIQAADSLLEPVNWTKEERDMIDERIRNRENYEMNIATAKREGRDEGLQLGLKQGLTQGREQGVKQGLAQAHEEARLQRARSARSMVARGFDIVDIADILGVTISEVENLLANE